MTGLTFSIHFRGPFHVATGKAEDTDDRRVDERQLLPASSLKGLLRDQASNVLGIPTDLVDQIFGARTEPGERTRSRPATGPVPHAAGAWAFSDAEFAAGYELSVAARIELGERGAVEDGSLMIGQEVWAPTAAWHVEPLVVLPAETAAAHRLVLRATVRSVVALGGMRRRGSGWVRMHDDTPWSDQDTANLLELQTWVAPRAETATAATAVPAGLETATILTLDYEIHLDQRVAAGTGAEVGNAKLTHSVVPGSVIRGALAGAWMREHGLTVADAGMAEIFERDLIVHQAVPAGFRLTPCSEASPKYATAAQHPTDLAQQAVAKLTESEDLRSIGRTDVAPELGCEMGRGWPTAAIVEQTRTALSQDGTPDPAQLYTRRSLADRQILRGTVTVPAGSPVAEWLAQPLTLRVGGQLSISGRVSWTAAPAAAREHGSDAGVQILQVLSPTIVLDEFGAPSADLLPELRQLLGEKVTIAGAGNSLYWLRTTRVGGWHASAGLPKPEDWAIAPGSTFVLGGLPPDAADRLAQGVGYRRLEGFGQVRLIDASGESKDTKHVGAEVMSTVSATGVVRGTGLGASPGRPARLPGPVATSTPGGPAPGVSPPTPSTNSARPAAAQPAAAPPTVEVLCARLVEQLSPYSGAVEAAAARLRSMAYFHSMSQDSQARTVLEKLIAMLPPEVPSAVATATLLAAPSRVAAADRTLQAILGGRK